MITGVDVTDTEALRTVMLPAITEPLDMVINNAGDRSRKRETL